MDMVSELPNELSTQVFNYFNVFELAKLERVSKSWQSIIRANSTLWKDDRFDKNIFELCAIQHEGKYKAMLERSGGRLDKVFLPICLPFNTQDKLESLLWPLPKSEVKDLWIVIRTDTTCPDYHKHQEMNVSDRQLEEAVKAVLKAVVHCDQLKYLRLVSSSEGVNVDMRNFGNPAKWPFSTNRLKKLALQNIKLDSLFPCDDLFQVISQAEEIEMNYTDDEVLDPFEKDIWSFISTAKDTLKKLFVYYSPGKPITDISEPVTYNFPRLEQLTLGIMDKVAALSGNMEIVRQNLNCPTLKMLNILPFLPPKNIEQLLCKGIEELHVSALPYEAESRKRLKEKMEKCTKVKKLIFHNSVLSKHIKDVSVWLRRAPLEEIKMEMLQHKPVKAVKRLVKDRLVVGPFTKVQKLTISTLEGEPKEEIEWFKKHVPKVDVYTYYDRSCHRETELQNRGMYYFELQQKWRFPDLSGMSPEKNGYPLPTGYGNLNFLFED